LKLKQGESVMAIDSVVKLGSWDSVSKLANWETLLLGNGSSTNIWSGFGYDGLLREAVAFPIRLHLRAHLDCTLGIHVEDLRLDT